ncbi:MAG: hypothetical protein Q9223_003442 [Gallowayella weberi]
MQDRIYEEALKERKAFLSALQAFHDEDRENSRVSLGIIPESDWPSVLQVVNSAQIEADDNAITGVKGAVRKLARKLGVAGPAFVAWLEMLPNDAYGSVICGGFKIIIDAAVRHKELCEEVLGALGDIPEAIKDSAFSFSQYKSEELDKRVATLYTTITETLNSMLAFYRERAPGRHMRAARNAFKSVVKGPNYGQRIKADIEKVKDCASSVKQEADRCLHRRLGEVKDAQEYQTLQAAHIRRLGTEGLNLQQKIYADLKYRMRCQELEWSQKNSALHSELKDLKRAITPKPVRKNGPSLRKVIQLMGSSTDQAIEDLEDVLREGQQFPPRQQTQASLFMDSQKLQSWLTSPYSSALLAHGSSGDDKVSALSFVASLLVQSLQSSEDAAVLYSFCGLHTDAYRDSLANAPGMIQGIIAQLLRMEQHNFDLEFIDRRFIQLLESGNLEALSNLLEGLTQQLSPTTTLFFIIDGISFYETKDRLEDTCYSMSRLLGMVENAKFVMKILVSSPGASAHVSKGFHHSQIYWLPDVDPEEDGAFDHNVNVFRNQAESDARESQLGLMRSDSEWYEGL